MDNAVSFVPTSKIRGNRQDAFDALPARVRRALMEANLAWCPLEIAQALKRRENLTKDKNSLEIFMVNFIRFLDENEIEMFAAKWPERFGEYPHVAAKATIMRYDERRKRYVTREELRRIL